jgi:hypothetical protein
MRINSALWKSLVLFLTLVCWYLVVGRELNLETLQIFA